MLTELTTLDIPLSTDDPFIEKRNLVRELRERSENRVRLWAAHHYAADPSPWNTDRGGEEQKGVNHSNTPPQSLQTSQGRLTGGEDWFEVMVYLAWDEDALAAVAEHLDAMKESVSDGSSDGWTSTLPGSRGLWKVEPHGCRLGEKGKGPILRWCLSRDGIVFGLTHRLNPHETLPSGFVRMTGDFLIANGDARTAWLEVVEWFKEIGARVTLAKVSRVDMCVDLPGVHVEEFVKPYLAEMYTTRCKVSACHSERDEREGPEMVAETLYKRGRSYTGFSLGGATRLRVYDKIEECKDMAVLAWLSQRRWGGSIPDAATRVEFQLRRSFLMCEKLKPSADGTIARPVIDTVEDYFTHRAELAKYLTTQWCVFKDGSFDPAHPERSTCSQLWQRVQEDFAAWAGDTRLRRYDPPTREDVPLEDLVRQAVGCFESAIARSGEYIEDPDQFFWSILPHIESAIAGRPVADRILQKMKHSLPTVRRRVDIPF